MTTVEAERLAFVAGCLHQHYTREHAEQLAELVYPADQAPAARFRAPAAPPAPPAAPPSDAEVRAWAREAGVGCPPRGKVPAAVMTAYREAH
jgi:Lsr2